MASSQGAAGPVWRCVHCPFELPGVSVPLKLCPTCGKPQVEEVAPSIQETPPRAGIEKVRNTAEDGAATSPPPVQPEVQPYQGTPQPVPAGFYHGSNLTAPPQQTLNTSFGKEQGAVTNPERPTMEQNVHWTPQSFPGSPGAMQHLGSMWNQQQQQGVFASQQFPQGNPQNWGGYNPQQMGTYGPQQQWGGGYGLQQQHGVSALQHQHGGVQQQGIAYGPPGQQGGTYSPHQAQQSSSSSLPPPLQPTPANQPETQPPSTSSYSQLQNQTQPGFSNQQFPPGQGAQQPSQPQPESVNQQSGAQQPFQLQPGSFTQSPPSQGAQSQPHPQSGAQQPSQPQGNQPQSLSPGADPHFQPAPSAQPQVRTLPITQPGFSTPTSVQQGQQSTVPPQTTSLPENTRPPQTSQLQQAQENGVRQAASSGYHRPPQQSGKKQHGGPAQPLGRGKPLQPTNAHPLEDDTSSKTGGTKASSKASNEKPKTTTGSQSSKGKTGTQPPPKPAPPRPPGATVPGGGSSSVGKNQTETRGSYSAAAKGPPSSTPAGANENVSSRKKDDQYTRKLRSHSGMHVCSTEGVLESRDRERAVTLNFHVILPLEHWLWDEESRICLRFGHMKLGDWEEDVGKFEVHKDLDGKHYWMRCTLYVDPNILSKGKFISYKYAVFSPRRKDANPYEFFHDCPKKHLVTDRCLIVPSEFCKPKGSHTRFDGMVFPEELPQSLGKRLKNLLFGSSEVRQLSFSEAQEFSLHAFLEEHGRLLRSLDSPSSNKVSNLEKFVNAVFKIYEQLRVRQTCINDWRDEDWIAPLLAKAFKDWLIEIIYSLNNELIQSVADNGKRISLVLIIVDLLGKLMGQLHDSEFGFDEINTIFEMLALRPDLSKSSSFRDLNDVLNFIPQNYRKQIASVFACFVNRILPSNHLENTNWVYAMPIMHALDGKLDKETSSDVIKWHDGRVNMWNLGKPEKLAFLKVIKELQEGDAPFVKLDPLLLPMLVKRCPHDELPKVVPFIPILLSAAIIKELITKGTKVSKLVIAEIKELVPVVENITLIVPNIQKQVHGLDLIVYKKKYDDVQALFFEAKTIFEEGIKRLSAFGPVNASFLHVIICFLLQTASKLKECCTDDLARSTWIVAELDKLWPEMTGLLLNEWIVKYCTPMFGGTDLKASDKDIKMTEEFIGLSCPANVLADWQAILEDTLKQRVARIPNKQKLDLLNVIEKKSPHAIVMNVFMDEVTRSFETEYNTASLQKLFERSKGKYRSTIGRVLDKIFKKEYPEEMLELPIRRLLTWDMWPIAMKIYKSELMIEGGGKVKSAQSSLSDKCSLMCSMADSSRSQMMEEINDGTVTFRDMEFFLEKQNEIEKLCGADDSYKVAEVQVVLKKRKFECATFRDYKAKLDSFCSKLSLSKLQVAELSDLLKEIKVDHSDCPLKSLCCAEDSLQDIQHFRFKAAHPLQPILSPFHTFYRQYPSELFQQIWKSKIKAVAGEKVKLAIKDVVTKIWNPIFDECCQLIDSVKGMTITLSAVNDCFGNLEEKQSHLERLFKATEAFYGRQVESTIWIRKAIDRMHMYWSICEQADAAKTVLELKDSLKLEGDFQVIENVAGAFTKSMDKQTLNDIDQRLIEMSSFLEHFTKDRKKLESLKSFAACLEIVEWIRKESQDVNDLHKFVTIALHTSVEEGDLSSDRLSHLKVVGSGFGPLIYGLKNDPSFESFQQGCLAVWDAIDEAPNLPKLLMACNEDLEWYKSVKETQASFEVTSFGQMDNIFQYGSYIVGSAKSHIFQHYHDVIQLTLKARDKRLTKTSYTLEELRDLESKLVLITGSKAENRAKVDIFIDTLHSICRIAEVLLTLQQVGNVNYTGWVLQVRCSTDRQLIDQLQAQASNMEDELSQWEEDVTSQRENFYELNYFTTLQLLTLRRELGRLKDPKATATISPEVLILIQSISSQVESAHVIDSVNQILLESKQEQESEQVPLAKTFDPPTQANEAEQKDLVALPDESDSQSKATSEPKEVDKQPTYSEDSLSDELRGYITTIASRISCSRQLVCKSFDVLGRSLTRIDYERWCVQNEDEDTFKENEDSDEDSSDSESDSGSSDSESSDHEEKEFTYTSESTVKTQSTLSSSQKKKPVPHVIKIERIAKELVDENHPAVIQLINAGYSEKQSIDAIAKYRTLEEAMDHMEDTSSEGDSDEEREPDLFPSVARQFSRENSLPFFEMDWDNDNDLNIYYLKEAEEKYLKLEYLGRVLRSLTHLPSTVQVQRTFPTDVLKEGYPNLLVGPPENILRTVLSLYMVNHDVHPLPTPEEVLVCYPSTTAEEIELFWRRAINDPEYKRIFCLVHAEKLTYQVSDQALSSLSKLSQAHQNYRLVIVCSNEEESMSYFISKLHMYKRAFMAPSGDDDFKEYLISKFSKASKLVQDCASNQMDGCPASIVDYEGSCVRIVKCDRSGMGKSLYVRRLAENLQQKRKLSEIAHVTIPLHGPVITPDTVLELFQDHMKNPSCYIYHIDIAPNILWKVDTILFSLLILQCISDSQGRVWRCHPNQLYAVEVTIPNLQKDAVRQSEKRTLNILDLLPSVVCQSPKEVLKRLKSDQTTDKSLVLMDPKEFESSTYQRVYQYIRRYAAGSDLNFFSFSDTVEGTCENCLEVLLKHCGVANPSWSEIRHFAKFLNLQLKSCEESVFTTPELIKDVMVGLKGFVIKFMFNMSRDFSTASLRGEYAQENEKDTVEGTLDVYQINEAKLWIDNPHPYIFFNNDGVSITFVGFNVTKEGNLINPEDQKVIERNIMKRSLYDGLVVNGVNFADNHRKWKKNDMIQKICTVMGVFVDPKTGPKDPDKSYVLTVDNVIKMLAIQMRFRCGIPVVIMGETGCGKTRLIRYMCDLAKDNRADKINMIILKVHGGTSEEDISKFIKQAEKISKENKKDNLDTVVFFDEANTTDAIGLIKEVMCDRRINGKPISDDLKFIAACNPYRRHNERMIERLENAGLGFFVKPTETQQKLGEIPLRQLVYRVLELPPSMRPLVYDFGQLNIDTEGDYIKQIVQDYVADHSKLSKELVDCVPIANALVWSQSYMREREDECSFVSLRDVKRAMIVFEYLYDMMDTFGPLMDEWASGERRHVGNEDDDQTDFKYTSPGPIARAFILSLSVCYHARLENRDDYENGVVKHFTGPIKLTNGAQQFRDEIRWCQEALLDSMHLDSNIARNAALRENVFMMAICVELRIPLFLVGKPGSSKSLAKSIISESMRGKDSRTPLLKKFKEVGIFSYQCSQLSTPESVIEVFTTASKFQARQDKQAYVAVVVLDEVGLAEDSPNLPLKALHPLLEDGTEGTKKDFTDQIVAQEERVAFIGISNWALDPAKMNRGVMVTRADPSQPELVLSARGICSMTEHDPIKGKLDEFFNSFATSYINICKKQERQFFGLRDFYSLIKMLYYMCKKSGLPPTWPQLEHAIKRNFGGLESEEWSPFAEFERELNVDKKLPDVPEEKLAIINPDCSELSLIRTSLGSSEQTWQGENRYVLFLTENYAALDILMNPKNYLGEGLSLTSVKSEPAVHQGIDQKLVSESQQEGQVSLDAKQASEVQPFILFGSSFPKDKEYTQVCRNINQIKICMETGRTVILLNLENLYESLYDVLNQYYIYHAGSKYVDLGLQTHRVRCRVDDNFKLILIAEKNTVYEHFPTPLINRLEKHFVLTSSILEEWQGIVLKKFQEWIMKFSKATNKVTKTEFSVVDAFIGFQSDTPAAVVFQATNTARAGSPEEVFETSKFLLLQTASPDAIVRLECTSLADEKESINRIYSEDQYHKSMIEFLRHFIYDSHTEGGLLLQVTTRSHLLSHESLKQVQEKLGIRVFPFFLHEFDTELDFSNKIGQLFKLNFSTNKEERLVIIQCDLGSVLGDLIACARYRIYDLRAKADEEQRTHVLFIIHLSHQGMGSFVGFQGDPWVSYHIDDLNTNTETTISASEAIGLGLCELFRGPTPSKAVGDISEEEGQEAREDSVGDVEEVNIDVQEQKTTPKRMPLYTRLHSCIQAAASKVKDFTAKRCTKRVEILVNLIPKECKGQLDTEGFHGILIEHITRVLEQHVKVYPAETKWVVNEAMNAKSLHQGGTFRNVLSRKVDTVVIPIFSEIIAAIDQNCNLNLIDPRNESAPVSSLWLQLFKDPSIINFDYNDMITAKDQLIGLGGKRAQADFKCDFPFSWLIHDAVKSQWDNAKSSAGYDVADLHKHLCTAIENTAIGEVLGSVQEEEVESMYLLYLHDFVRFEHTCNHKQQTFMDKEYHLISKSLNALVHGDDYGSLDGHISLTSRIAALHVVYRKNISEILWFGQLVAFFPGILDQLKEEVVGDQSEMMLHLYAVEQALKSLDPEQHLEKDNPAQNLIPWLNEVHASQNAISSSIELPSQSDIKVESRLKWEAVRVLQLFLEHVLLKHTFEKGMSHLIRLNVRLGSSRDFLKAPALKMIQAHLNRMHKDVKKELKKSGKSKEFKSNCQYYFIEVVSTLCFGGQAAPEPELIKMLLDIIFTENADSEAGIATREIVPMSDEKSDKIPVIRSSLLQLLLEHDDVSTEEYLQEYLLQSRKFFSSHKDDSLYLLCIQCFEDALYKKHCHRSLQDKVEVVIRVLEKHRNYKSQKINSLNYLAGVAGIRFAISEIANIQNFLFVNKDTERSQETDLLVARLMQQAQDVCVSSTNPNEVLGQAIFLLKMIVRQFGFSCLKFVFGEYDWVIPVSLQTKDEVLDPFVIYKGDICYSTWRTATTDALFGKDVANLTDITQNCSIKEAAVFLLAMYESITMEYSSARPMDDDLLQKLNEFLLGVKTFSPQMLQAARCLLTNQQGGNLAEMTISEALGPEQKTLGALVVHVIIVLFSNLKMQILQPFISMLENPASLENAFLPTMVEGVNLTELVAILKAANSSDYGGNFVHCPNGHLYYVGNCGKARDAGKCNVCDADIGGENHVFREGNVKATKTETTESGYTLGLPESRTSIPAPERSLSSPSICVIRAIMHSAFLWCSCHEEDKLPELANVVKQRANLPEFFWMHLNKDIEQLSRVTGKGIEESILILHLVLHNIFVKDPPANFNYASTAKSLSTKEGRREWEKAFNAHYIQPVLGNLDEMLTDALDAIANDDKKEHSPMFYQIYEKTKLEGDSLEPHLWSYRQRISLEHIAQTLQEKKLNEMCPVLHEFLQLEPSLRATQYLPDIVKLQNSLYDLCHHRLDHGVAKTQTIEEFLSSITNENTRNEYTSRIESFRKAWALVGHDLKKHARIHLDDEHCLPAITKETTIEYLIPTYTGAGAITTCLVDYLIRIHNDFLKTCREIVIKKTQSSWTMLNVPITHIHRCHLLDYEHQIVSVILSHCCYSLRVGEAHTVHYDYQAIEKHILDKFIHGKPKILSELPQVVYRKNIYTTVTLRAIRKNVNPQVKLDSRARKEIVSELRTADRLRESLDVVDIVIGFLSSGGVKAEKPLGEYIDKRLKMKKRLSQKLRQFCNLQHILSLWETLSVELAKLMVLQNQDPFDGFEEKHQRELEEDQIATLDRCLRTFDLDRLLGALYEFMETFVKHCPDRQLTWAIIDVLDTDQFEHLEIEEHFFREFSDTISLDQTVAVWKHIVLYQKKWNNKT